MSLSDPIADLLTRVRNAKEARHKYLDVKASKVKLNIVRVMKEQGFIENFLVDENRALIRIYLKYGKGRQPVIQGIRRISKPGLRRYVKADKIPYILKGMGIAILSTSQGVFDGETARQKNVGGELLCYVW